MGWCDHCQDEYDFVRDPGTGYTCCTGCGKVIDSEVFTNDATFEKTSSGQTRLAGTLFRGESGLGISRERTLEKGRYEIQSIVSSLQIGGGDSIVNEAHRFYQIAVDKSFTKGRRTVHVAAACLYLACRASREPKPYLLIDFSDYLSINVYVLGAVFLQLCHKLRLEEHPFVQKIIDPSLFIHRFTERLLGRQKSQKNPVSETALRIVASMKRDWMQTGRKPSGLCGAALYISALSHGLKFSKSDIVSVVHICEATLTKRLVEFENTESGGLTIEEFLTKADELRESDISQLPRPGKVLCAHEDEAHFAHGLCRECYNEFVEISGGVQGGAEPPAFQRAELERQKMEKEKGKEMTGEWCDFVEISGGVQGGAEPPAFQRAELERQKMEKAKGKEMTGEWCDTEIEDASSSKIVSDSTRNESLVSSEPENTGNQTDNITSNQSTNLEDLAIDDQESLSDIDDEEVIGYLHNEDEKQLKEIIWTEMNKEYLEEQAAKEAAAAQALPKPKKERKKRSEEAKNAIPADTPLKATRQMLDKKKLSSRINYDALDALYSDQGNVKKQRTESDVTRSECDAPSGGMKYGDEDTMGDGGFEEVDFSAYVNGEEYYPYEDQADGW